MSKRNLVFLLLTLALLFLPGRTSAQSFPVFVSVIDTGQIVKVQMATATIFHTFTGFGTVLPEDMVVGPDGRLYVCDSFGSRIFRINIEPDGSAGTVVVIADLTDVPTGPEGPSFLGDTLYFNTRAGGHTGVWKIPGVAAVDSAPFPEPVNLIPSISVGAIPFGEGTAFDPQGRFIIVDRAGDRILRASAPFTSFSVIIENPAPPADPIFSIARGVAVNGAGEIFVSNAFLFNIVRCVESAGTFTCSEFASFKIAEFPAFMEFDAAGNLLVVTSDFSVPAMLMARLYEVVSSVVKNELGAFPISDEVVGLALPATEVSKVAEFRDNQKTNTYDFDSHKFILSLDVTPDTIFNVKITARDVLSNELKTRLASNVFSLGSDCVRFPGKGGKCVVYLAEGNPSSLPIPGEDFTGDIDILIKYFDDPVSPAANPRMAHDSDEVAGDEFTEDITVEFFPSPNPDTDPALRGRTINWSQFVAVDLATDPAIFIGFLKPLGVSGKVFKSGRTIPVKFQLTDGDGNPITDAVAHISVAKISNNVDGLVATDVEASGAANTDNLFRFDGDKYVYNLSTKGLTPGTYQLTVISTKFLPHTETFVSR